MKKITVVIALLCLISCKPKTIHIPLKTYDVILIGKELNLTGTGYDLMRKQETVMALDDTTAYNKALISYYSKLRAEKLTKNKVSTTTSFEVRDSTGMDLSIILPKNVVDSLTKRVEGFSKRL